MGQLIAVGLSSNPRGPADAPLTVYDFPEVVASRLEAAGYPDYAAELLAAELVKAEPQLPARLVALLRREVQS